MGQSSPRIESRVSSETVDEATCLRWSGRTEAMGGSPKVIHPSRTEQELSRWDRGPERGIQDRGPGAGGQLRSHPSRTRAAGEGWGEASHLLDGR